LARTGGALKPSGEESDFRHLNVFASGPKLSSAKEIPMDTHAFLLFVHVCFGTGALSSYWVAALAKKGSRSHKLAGKIYVFAMIGLLIPALPLALRILSERSVVFGWFLIYLFVITVTVLWRGWFAIHRKLEFERYAGSLFRALAVLNIAAGGAMLAFGAKLGQPIFMGFSLVGMFGGISMLRLAGTGPKHPCWWLCEHLGAMLGCGIATHVAFLSIGLPRLLPALQGGTAQNLAWLGPLSVALIARVWLGRKYLRFQRPLPIASR